MFLNLPFLLTNGQNVSTAQFGEGIAHNTIGNFIIWLDEKKSEVAYLLYYDHGTWRQNLNDTHSYLPVFLLPFFIAPLI